MMGAKQTAPFAGAAPGQYGIGGLELPPKLPTPPFEVPAVPAVAPVPSLRPTLAPPQAITDATTTKDGASSRARVALCFIVEGHQHGACQSIPGANSPFSRELAVVRRQRWHSLAQRFQAARASMS